MAAGRAAVRRSVGVVLHRPWKGPAKYTADLAGLEVSPCQYSTGTVLAPVMIQRPGSAALAA